MRNLIAVSGNLCSAYQSQYKTKYNISTTYVIGN